MNIIKLREKVIKEEKYYNLAKRKGFYKLTLQGKKTRLRYLCDFYCYDYKLLSREMWLNTLGTKSHNDLNAIYLQIQYELEEDK